MLRTRRSRHIFINVVILFVCLQGFGALGAWQGYKWTWDETKVYGWEAYWAMQVFVALMFFTIYGICWLMWQMIVRGRNWADRGDE